MLVMTSTPTRRRTPSGSLTVLVVLLLLWAVWARWFTTAPDTNPGGQCSGLGFGCTLTPHDFAAFVGIIVVAPLTVVVVAATLVVRMVRIRRGSSRTVWDVVLGAVLLGAGLLWLIGTLAGSF